ncbi:hypothetical protein V496_00441 [Pseudogymnoascus sp. VKM F-4515 (FW-2607)]|nr:hypothetical protein V496_00441 [Pseudogymnoascus sp. VKM F-4515 (FW-2607)]
MDRFPPEILSMIASYLECRDVANFRLQSRDCSRCGALGMVQTIYVRFRQASLRRLRCIAESPLAPHVKNLVYYIPAGHIVDSDTTELPFFRSIESDEEMNNSDYDDEYPVVIPPELRLSRPKQRLLTNAQDILVLQSALPHLVNLRSIRIEAKHPDLHHGFHVMSSLIGNRQATSILSAARMHHLTTFATACVGINTLCNSVSLGHLLSIFSGLKKLKIAFSGSTSEYTVDGDRTIPSRIHIAELNTLLRNLRHLEVLEIDFDDIIMAACESEPWFAWDNMAKGITWTGLKSITLPGGYMTQPFMESFLQRHSKTLQKIEIRPVVLEGSWLGLFKVGRGLQLQSIVLPSEIYHRQPGGYTESTDSTTIKLDTARQLELYEYVVSNGALPQPYEPTIYIDLEGVNLCREGSLSILTLLIDTGISTMRVCLIDVHSLGPRAFNTAGIKGRTLKHILQDENIPKVFFDVRNDSDALFADFGVALQGVEDVQLMESATRTTTGSRKYLNGLAKCVEGVVHGSDLSSWKLAKEKGGRLFKAECGGSYDVFEQRPIPNEIISYCVGDVHEETKKRVEASQKPEYQPHGPNRTLAPWCEDQNRKLDEWNYVPPPRDYFGEEDDWDSDEYNDWRDDALYPRTGDDKMAKAKDIFAAALQIVDGAAAVYITKREVSDETGSGEMLETPNLAPHSVNYQAGRVILRLSDVLRRLQNSQT